MNFKLLFPTYRARERYLAATLADVKPPGGFARACDVGCGEGELHARIAAHTARLDACDLNEEDVTRAAALNADLDNVRYAVASADRLPYPGGAFDLVTCLEVIEHVRDPLAFVAELARITAPGGTLILTCPNHDFPTAYDPINARRRRHTRPLPIGAYGYGHDWLVREELLLRWLRDAGFEPTRSERLSGALAAITEAYVPGLLQRALKANAANTGEDRAPAAERRTPTLHVRDRRPPPALIAITDALVRVDARLGGPRRPSVGLAVVAQRTE